MRNYRSNAKGAFCILTSALVCFSAVSLRGVETKIAEKLQSKYSMSLVKATSKPKIDGILDETGWKTAAKATNFMLFTGEDKAREDSEAYVMYDENYIYIGMICYSKDTKKLKTGKKVFDGDCVEIFLDPGCTEYNYAHVAVNPKGKAYLALGTGETKHNIKSAAKVYNDRWQVEIAVPYTDLQFPSNKNGNVDLSIWGMNFCRGNVTLKEWTCWSPTLIGFHNPAKFGIVSGINNDFSRFLKKQNKELELSDKEMRVKTDRLFYSAQENIIVTISLSPDIKSLKGGKLELTVKDEKGATLLSKKLSKIMLTTKIPVKIKDFPEGQLQIETSFSNKNEKVYAKAKTLVKKIKKASAPRNKLTMDDDGTMYLNGQPTIPIATWLDSGWSGPIEKEEFKDIAAKGFDIVMPGYTYTKEETLKFWKKSPKHGGGGRSNLVKQSKFSGFPDFLETISKYGLYCFGMIGDISARFADVTDEQLMDAGDIVLKYRNSPAVLGWFSFDETDGWVKTNRKVYDVIKEVDPYREVWLNLINGAGPNRENCDILSLDPYPIGKVKINKVAVYVDMVVNAQKGLKRKSPWVVLQMFGSPHEGWPRPPSPNEIRCMTFLALNHGAKGLGYFAYYCKKSRAPGSRLNPQLWEYMKTVNHQTKEMSLPYLLGAKVEGIKSSAKALDIAAVKYKNKTYVIAVNIENKKLKAEIDVNKIKKGGKVVVKFEFRNINLKNGMVVDSFNPYDVHIYVIGD